MSEANEGLDDFLDEGMDKFLRYRWEFLRRNEDYQREWEELDRLLQEKGVRSRRNSEVIYETPEESAFCEMWNINHPVFPYSSYDEYYFQALKLSNEYKNVRLDPIVSIYDEHDSQALMEAYKNAPLSHLHWKLAPRKDYPIRELSGADFYQYRDYDPTDITAKLYYEFIKSGKVRIEIDLYYSKLKIREYLEEYIDRSQDILKNQQGEEYIGKKRKYSKKAHFDNFDYYLAVYDLRRAKTSWSKLEKFLHTNGRETATFQTARDYHEAAKRLVKEGLSP